MGRGERRENGRSEERGEVYRGLTTANTAPPTAEDRERQAERETEGERDRETERQTGKGERERDGEIQKRDKEERDTPVSSHEVVM